MYYLVNRNQNDSYNEIFSPEKFASTCINIAQLALAVTKKRNICYPNTIAAPKSDLRQGIQWLKEKIESVKCKILPSIELHDMSDNSVTLALSDVTLIMAFLCKNFGDVIINKKALDVQCVDIIEYGGLEQMLADIGTSNQQEKSSEAVSPATAGRNSCCAMF